MAQESLISEEAFDTLFAAPSSSWVFKHSNACPVSTVAQREVDDYVAAHPGRTVHRVVVQTHRAVSHHIAAATGIRHESPQLLLLRGGVVVWSASHGAITQATMEEVDAR